MSHHINILTTLKNTNVAFRGKINLQEKKKKRLVREKTLHWWELHCAAFEVLRLALLSPVQRSHSGAV